MVSPTRVIQIYEAVSDAELTHQESMAIATSMISDGGSIVMFATVMWFMGMMGMMISKQVSGNPKSGALQKPEGISAQPMSLEILEALETPILDAPELGQAVHQWIGGERNIGQLQRLIARYPEVRKEQIKALKAQYGDKMIVYHGGFLPDKGVISVSVLKHVAGLRATAIHPTRAFKVDTGRITMAIPTIGEQELIADVRVLEEVVSGSPSNPGSITSDIVERAGLKPYEPKFTPREEREKPKRVRIKAMAFTTRFIGPYEVIARRTDGGFQVRLYENLPGARRRFVAYQVAGDVYELERMFNKTVEAIHQVRFEHKTALRK